MMNKKNWIVRVECTVLKDIYADNCTEKEARTDPFAHSTHEEEVDQRDCAVKSVEVLP